MSKQTLLKKDLPNKKLIITREFAAPPDFVWRAWTEAELLDEWWAPKPWKTNTVSMDFRNGGRWHYYMQGPDGSRHYCLADYSNIIPHKSYSYVDAFCDEKGNKNPEMPSMNWTNTFTSTAEGNTLVHVEISFKKVEDIERIIEMGFQEGFTMAHANLDEYLKAKFKLKNDLAVKGRTSTYLNFDGKTEEAFLFYRSIFKTEFSGKGIQRFGEIPAETGHPPVADNIKKMILHVELPITGGHVIMATDAPKEMGFTLETGTNMHIHLEPETKEETKRLFDALSAGGKVIMNLQDMFWGGYFGQCTDKYGINWMFNYGGK